MTELTLNTKSFFSALDEGKLIGSRCKKCSYTVAPQRVICPKCHADQMELIEFSGKGKLAAYTRANWLLIRSFMFHPLRCSGLVMMARIRTVWELSY